MATFKNSVCPLEAPTSVYNGTKLLRNMIKEFLFESSGTKLT